MYVCVCVYIHIYIFICVCIYIYTHTYIYISLEGNISRIGEAEGYTSKLQERIMKITQEVRRPVKKINEDWLREFWNQIKHNHILIIEFSEREKREKGTEKVFAKIMAEKFYNKEGNRRPDIKGTEKVSKRPTQVHIIIKMTKNLRDN